MNDFGASGRTLGQPASTAASAELMPSGYPSPAQDWFENRIDLNRHLIKDITSTYIMRVSGHAMDGIGISDGDELIVDRALQPKDGSVVIAVLDGELIIRQLRVTGPHTFMTADASTGDEEGAANTTSVTVALCAANSAFPPIPILDPENLVIWGVVTRCLHHV